MIKKLSERYIVVNDKGFPFLDTVCFGKSAAIKTFLEDANNNKWAHWKRKQFRCVKVNITFTEVKQHP